ncbi:uncharacterized protein LOC118784381 [Megalops cyprinoides]|uniref:uncharacterized protein LOC118784381 n=1 Tax=Megalops cyprinoides TaxID=118141 RepID=UPI001864C188|nr:uncharacterized protein LOC118784381 [Megalops cyprinoides]
MSGKKEMAACCAKNCPNTSCPPSGTSEPALLHSFPRWGSRGYKLWAGMVGVSPLPAVPKLCSLHFTSDQYKRTGVSHGRTLRDEDSMRAKKLKKNALPSLFYDSDGDLFEMVPVTVPEYSDENPVEDTILNDVIGDLQPPCTEIQEKTFSTVHTQEKTKENCSYHPHWDVLAKETPVQAEMSHVTSSKSFNHTNAFLPLRLNVHPKKPDQPEDGMIKGILRQRENFSQYPINQTYIRPGVPVKRVVAVTVEGISPGLIPWPCIGVRGIEDGHFTGISVSVDGCYVAASVFFIMS